MRLLAALVFSGVLAGCYPDETVTAYGAGDKTWMLTELDGATDIPVVTLSFPEPGRISGKAPCNLYTAEMTAPYPWFETGPIAATKLACPDMPAEAAFFDALAQMTLAEVQGDTLILSNTTGAEMVFTVFE